MLLLALTLLGACGIPIESEPETLDVEIEVAGDDPAPQPGNLAAVTLYLVSDETLVRVTRDLPDPAGLAEVLRSLLEGATSPEERADLRSAIPPGTRLLGVELEPGLARVDLSGEFAAVGGEEETLAVAQIVMTTTSAGGIDGVVFELEGVPTAVPVAGGALSADPVRAGDYASLVSP